MSLVWRLKGFVCLGVVHITLVLQGCWKCLGFCESDWCWLDFGVGASTCTSPLCGSETAWVSSAVLKTLGFSVAVEIAMLTSVGLNWLSRRNRPVISVKARKLTWAWSVAHQCRTSCLAPHPLLGRPVHVSWYLNDVKLLVTVIDRLWQLTLHVSDITVYISLCMNTAVHQGTTSFQ